MNCPVCNMEVDKIWDNGYGCEHCTRELNVDELNHEIHVLILKLKFAINTLEYICEHCCLESDHAAVLGAKETLEIIGQIGIDIGTNK